MGSEPYNSIGARHSLALYLSNVIKVTMSNVFLSREFLDFVEKDVELVLGEQVAETHETKGLEWPVSNHVAEDLHVPNVL